jgi:hypothetical protein
MYVTRTLRLLILTSTISFCPNLFGQNEASIRAHLDIHCLDAAKQYEVHADVHANVDAFYSFKTNGCVLVEVDEAGWSYSLRDFTHSLFTPPKLVAVETPLHVYHDSKYGIAMADGYWQATDKSEDKQLISKIAAKISCSKPEAVCREADATMFIALEPDTHDYSISSWTEHGIVADDSDEGQCAIGHRLSIDFDRNSVTVTDYPKSIGGKDCKPFQNANSYALHGGDLLMYGQDELFSCTKEGANSVIVRKVQELHGDVGKLPYQLWMDDAVGGKPATMQTPPNSFSRDQCKRLMAAKVAELKSM